MEEIFPQNEIFRVSALDSMQQDEKELFFRLVAKIREKLEGTLCK